MKKSKLIDKDDLCFVEEVEENGFCDVVLGTPIAQFTFGSNLVPSNDPMIKQSPADVPQEISFDSGNQLNLLDNRTLKSQPNGITPPIDGEYFAIKCGFAFRRSTIRLLNELKAAHPDENVYLSTIVDNALSHYHKYIFEEKGSQN